MEDDHCFTMLWYTVAFATQRRHRRHQSWMSPRHSKIPQAFKGLETRIDFLVGNQISDGSWSYAFQHTTPKSFKGFGRTIEVLQVLRSLCIHSKGIEPSDFWVGLQVFRSSCILNMRKYSLWAARESKQDLRSSCIIDFSIGAARFPSTMCPQHSKVQRRNPSRES